LTLDPRSVDAQSWLGYALAVRVTNLLSESAAADIGRAEELIGQVLAASPRSAFAHYGKGQMLRWWGRCEEAIPEYEDALDLNRNLVSALNGLGWCKLHAGSMDEVIPLQQQAIRLSPRDPRIGWWYLLIGTVHLLQSRTDEAFVWLEKARSAFPAISLIRSNLTAAHALSGDLDRAATELAEARRLRGHGSPSSIAKMKAGGLWRSLSPKTRALVEGTYFAGLRKAGMPEE
jgi:adenylate cyclase